MLDRWLAGLTLAASAGVAAQAAVTVAAGPGGPQVRVDGEPVPLRCFFGVPGPGAITLSPEWTRYAYRVEPDHAIERTGTLHFRFAHAAAEFGLRGLTVRAAGSGEAVWPAGTLDSPEAFAQAWRVFPPDARNTVGTVTPGPGGVVVALRTPPDGNWPDFHLHSIAPLSLKAGTAYEIAFEARSSPPSQLLPAAYTIEGGVWHLIGATEGPFDRQLAMARDAGVRFVSLPMPACWGPPGAPQDWEPLDRAMRRVLAVHPEALVLPRVGMNAPAWWLERHPEARMRFEGDKVIPVATVSDRSYQREAADHLEALCRHLAAAFPRNFAGIHPCGQNTGEWFYEDSWGPLVSGYEPATREAWGAWRARRGMGPADIPAPSLRHDASQGALVDPARGCDLVEFHRFWQEEMAGFVLALAAAARRGAGGDRLVVFFYGYVFEFPPLRNGAPYSGHYALGKVLASKDIDVLCSPISYTDRQWLGTGPVMSAAESVALAGKVWLNEDDTRTHLSRTTDFGGVATLDETIAVLRRNTAQAALRGFGTWWMDLMGQGWFDDPAIWEEHRRLAALDTALLGRRGPYAPEVALLLDEDSICHLAGGSAHVARPLIYEARGAFGRSGAPYGQYLLADAAAGRVPARLQVHLASWALTPAVRSALAAARRPGQTRVWAYAPDCLTPEGLQPDRTDAVHGFRLRAVAGDNAVSMPTEEGRRLGITKPWGQSGGVRPLFTVETRPGDRILATYGDGSPSLAVRAGEHGTDVFAGTPAWTSEVARALCRLAGVHLFTEVDAALCAAEGYLCIQPHEEGPLRLDIGRPAELRDALTGAVLGRGPAVGVAARRGETRVLTWAPGPPAP